MSEGGGSGGGDPNDPKDKNGRIINTRQCKDQYEHYKDGIYRLTDKAKGFFDGKAHYLQWDHLHNDIEVYSKAEKHIGSMDPKTLQLYKGPQSHSFPS